MGSGPRFPANDRPLQNHFLMRAGHRSAGGPPPPSRSGRATRKRMIEPVATPSVLCSTADTRDQLIARSMVIATDNDEVAAEQADYRHRRRRGLRCIQVQVGPAELNRLV